MNEARVRSEAREAASSSRSGPSTAFFGRRYRLGEVLGFEVAIDASWFLVAVLVVWSLAAGLFPLDYPGLDAVTYWTMGVVATLGLFASVVVHELSHSLVARRHGLEMRGITLFIFGGVAHMGDEPATPKAELLIAIAGPLASVGLGVVFYLLGRLTGALAAPLPVTGVLAYLGFINLILAAFNTVPAFPLDGGRVLRAVLWRAKGSLRRATRISSRIGSGFGVALIVLGVLSFVGGNVVGGMWWALIGLFLRGAARMSYQQVLLREALRGEPVRRFMHPHPVTVETGTPVSSLVEEFFYRQYHKMYPVVEDGEVTGCVSIEQVKDVPRQEWGRRTVGELAVPCGEENTVRSDADALDALATMQRTGNSRLLVVEGDRLVGLLTLKDLLRFFAARIELEGG